MAKSDAPRIAVLGAGPIGLEAAVYARRLNLSVTVYERGRSAEYLHRWGHIRMFSPFGMNSTPLGRDAVRAERPGRSLPGDNDLHTGHDLIASYLEPLAQSEPLRDRVRLGTQVVHVGRRGLLKTEAAGQVDKRAAQPFLLLTRDAKGAERVELADVVLDCTGTFGQHRWMGDGGIPAVGEAAAEPHICYWLEDITGAQKAKYANKSVLVVGAGYSAATTVCRLAELAQTAPDTWTTWLIRGPRSAPIKRIRDDPLRERDRLAVRANTLATRGEGNVEFHANSVVESVVCHGPDKGFSVTARVAGKPKTWEVDRVVANVGFTPDVLLYRELQVHECYASQGPMALAAALSKEPRGDCLSIGPQGPAALRNPEPNFYILGSKSYGRNSDFLLRNGFAQVREVFTLVTGKSDLDLYKATR
jgi:thioredoxin reductase